MKVPYSSDRYPSYFYAFQIDIQIFWLTVASFTLRAPLAPLYTRFTYTRPRWLKVSKDTYTPWLPSKPSSIKNFAVKVFFFAHRESVSRLSFKISLRPSFACPNYIHRQWTGPFSHRIPGLTLVESSTAALALQMTSMPFTASKATHSATW